MKKILVQGSGLAGVALLTACGSAGAQQDKAEELVEAAAAYDTDALEELSAPHVKIGTNLMNRFRNNRLNTEILEEDIYEVIHIDPDIFVAEASHWEEDEGEFETYVLQFDDDILAPVPLTFEHHDDGFLFRHLGSIEDIFDLHIAFEEAGEESPLGFDDEEDGKTDMEKVVSFHQYTTEQTKATLEEMESRGYSLREGGGPEHLAGNNPINSSGNSDPLDTAGMSIEGDVSEDGNGEGRAYYNGNLIYQGDMQDGERHGFGIQYVLHEESGGSLAVHVGEWEYDQPNGFGLEYTTQQFGLQHAGEFLNGEKNGVGTKFSRTTCNEDITETETLRYYSETYEVPDAICVVPDETGEFIEHRLHGLGYKSQSLRPEFGTETLAEVTGMANLPERVMIQPNVIQVGYYEEGDLAADFEKERINRN